MLFNRHCWLLPPFHDDWTAVAPLAVLPPLSMTNPFVKLADSAVNFLTNSAADPASKIPEYKVCAVRVERIPTVSLSHLTGLDLPAGILAGSLKFHHKDTEFTESLQ